MKLAVLSGKGGTGKTFVSVNLAASADSAVYLDCDVEEPNGHLFLKPENIKRESVSTLLPVFDINKCTGCRKCIDFCRFNALAYIGNIPRVFSEVCHSCGGCALVCPNGAISEIKRDIGVVEYGMHNSVTTVTGILNLGEASGVPVIKAVLTYAAPKDQLTVIDCPPGSACTVMESIESADYCILVAESTAFGLHNFEMVYQLVGLLGKPCGVIINKSESAHSLIDTFCDKHKISILSHIPYSENLALIGAKAEIASEKNAAFRDTFRVILHRIGSEVGK